MEAKAVNTLRLELNQMRKNPPVNVSACPTTKNELVWEAIILGPENTPYAEGVYMVELTFPKEYPN
jgi:ubiquitin-protein ligase